MDSHQGSLHITKIAHFHKESILAQEVKFSKHLYFSMDIWQQKDEDFRYIFIFILLFFLEMHFLIVFFDLIMFDIF